MVISDIEDRLTHSIDLIPDDDADILIRWKKFASEVDTPIILLESDDFYTFLLEVIDDLSWIAIVLPYDPLFGSYGCLRYLSAWWNRSKSRKVNPIKSSTVTRTKNRPHIQDGADIIEENIFFHFRIGLVSRADYMRLAPKSKSFKKIDISSVSSINEFTKQKGAPMRIKQMNLSSHLQYVLAAIVVQAISFILFPEALYTFLGPGTIVLMVVFQLGYMAAVQYEYVRHTLGRELTYSLMRSDGSRLAQALRWYLGIAAPVRPPGSTTIDLIDWTPSAFSTEEVEGTEGVAIVCLPGETSEKAIARVQANMAAGCYPLDQTERINTALNGHKREEPLP